MGNLLHILGNNLHIEDTRPRLNRLRIEQGGQDLQD